MTTLEELDRRVSALEARTESDRRDVRRVLLLQEDALAQLEQLNRRTAALELSTSAGFDEVRGRLDRLEGGMAALRRDLPAIIAETLREVLREGRGG